MADETLLSSARRLVRFFNIDERHGGLISTDTLIARDTLQKQIEAEDLRLKRIAQAEAAEAVSA